MTTEMTGQFSPQHVSPQIVSLPPGNGSTGRQKPIVANRVINYSFQDVPQLTRAIKKGENSAFSWLHEQWSQRIYRYCLALAAGDETLASEIAQEVWIRLVKRARILPTEVALWNWLALAARHASIDIYRGKRRYGQMIVRFFETFSHSIGTTRHESENLEAELLRALNVSLQELGPAERALIEARYYSRMTLQQIGERNGISARAVEGRLARLRGRLREQMARVLQSDLSS